MVVRSCVRKNVRILLVGDRGVGKTSLILSLVSEEFPEDVPTRAEEITIPADLIPELVPTHIVDYSGAEQTEEELVDEMRRAHVVCLVYSVANEDSLFRITSYWLPLIKDSTMAPVILVGNKVDLIEDTTLETAEGIMEDYPEIESFVECSAKTLKNISEMFYYAQKAVLHPTGPVYMTDKQDLTEDCKKALTRIFRVCDLDNDGLLNDYELNAFQKRCFDMPLKSEAMEDVKSVLRRNIAGGVSPSNSITLPGFLYLHCLFIQRGKSHTTWTVLRKFGYNDRLSMSSDFLYPQMKIPKGSSTELNHKGQQFFTNLFVRFDKDKDGSLKHSEQEELFKVCPSIPWVSDIVNTVPTNVKGWVTLKGFLCFWNLTTLYNLSTTLEYLAYFGFPISDTENQSSAIHVTRERKLDLLKKQSTRNVYVCHVIGCVGVGKSSICRSFLNHSLKETSGDLSGNPQCCINVVHVYGQEKYLVMKEIQVSNLTEYLTQEDTQCDVVCLVYDVSSPKTFEYIARIYLTYFDGKRIPVLIVSSKCDLPDIRQDYLVQPTEFCDAHRLPPLHRFCIPPSGSVPTSTHELFQKLATMAAFPHLTELSLLRSDSVLWKAGFGIAMIAAVGVIVTKFLHKDRR